MAPFDNLQKTYPELYKNIKAVFNKVVTIRQDLHKHPELAFKETRTASIVAENLREWGYEVQEGVGKTGVVGLLKGKMDGPVVGLRADMDALPMMDEINQPYRSQKENVAHTCGHDSHTAILLGVAKILAENGLEKGALKVIFQPAEEIGEGAAAMIADGVLENPKVDMMAGLHVHPTVSTGAFSLASTEYSCAAMDLFEIKIHGKGGHAAHPHTTVDPVLIAAQVLVSLQQIVSRQTDPLDPVVLSIGQIHGGTKATIIPDAVTLSGTVRTLNPITRKEVAEKIESIARSVSRGLGGDCEITYNYVTPSIKIDNTLRHLFEETVHTLFSSESLKLTAPSMGGEDFAYYTHEVPSVFFRLGTNSGKRTSFSNHHSKFDVDEEAFLYGMAVLCHLTESYFEQHE
ncbi:amidohydrolase [Virgibacillus sp. NKC19-3]|uniref:M20 metallopeptidase family protein n=1 Tax=Virgibacillus saliphilus TaxID=2831674 RepID=UPI001C9B3542|nr:M20 family metallopeptidase [Virgibacillus sp. NKC19-3]MBY7143160.1 amidohydrolase [Virgibacillus sp. NKC19-3]